MSTYFLLVGVVFTAALLASPRVLLAGRSLPPEIRTGILLVVALVLGLFSGYQGLDVSNDRSEYYRWYQALNSSEPEEFLTREIGYNFLVSLSSWAGIPAQVFFSVLVSVAVLNIFLVASRNTTQLAYSILYYVVGLFVVHGMTQIRALTAVSLLVVAYDRHSKGQILNAWFFAGSACLFHYSAVVFLPFLLFHKISIRAWIAFVLSAAIIVPIVSEAIMFFVGGQLGGLDARIISYIGRSAANPEATLSYLKPSIIVKILLLIGNLALDRSQTGNNLARLELLSLCLYFVFSFSDVISTRLSEVLVVFDMVIVGRLLEQLKPRLFWRPALVAFCFFMLGYNLFVNNFLRPYTVFLG